jgi:hypothetical protein
VLRDPEGQDVLGRPIAIHPVLRPWLEAMHAGVGPVVEPWRNVGRDLPRACDARRGPAVHAERSAPHVRQLAGAGRCRCWW